VNGDGERHEDPPSHEKPARRSPGKPPNGAARPASSARAGSEAQHRSPTRKPAVGRHTAKRLAWAFGAAIALAALLAALLWWRHHHHLRAEAARRQQDADRGPRVFVSEARLQPDRRELTLAADVRGFYQSTVYARTSGYVKSILVDKGDQVQKGQLLGVLQSPELDQQVAAAAADLLAKRHTFERYHQLVKKDFVSAQDFENARAQYDVARATFQQMRAMQDYKTLRAPFAGVVTARYVDPGALVPAAAGSTQVAVPLVDLADLRRLRVLVFVQQDAAPLVHVGDPVRITVDQQPDLTINASISRCADALDPRTRTMLCEIWLDNEHRFFPGTFVHATLRLQVPALPLISSSALIWRDEKPVVAVIRQSRVHFQPVRPGLDDGKTIQIIQGIKPGDRVALALPSEIADGALVQPIEKKENPASEAGQQTDAGGRAAGNKNLDGGGNSDGGRPTER
jgi:RND family efflux transporter MFP subunit